MFKYWIFPAYLRAFRPRKKPRKRRPTDRGQMVMTGAVLSAALGLNTDSSFVYQLFALLLCISLAARLSLGVSRPKVSVKRLLPKHATAGTEFHYRIRITNIGTKVESDLLISDSPKAQLPNKQQYENEKEPGEESRNAYDRFIGFHRFIYLQKQLTGITTTPSPLNEVPVKGFVDVEIKATPVRRGRVEFQETLVLHQDPLGIHYGFNHFKNPQGFLVLPKRYRISPNWQKSNGTSFLPGSITSSWSIGESDEFVSLRDYRDGDAMRKIHWPNSAKQAAKKQSLVVKEYQDEFFSRNALVLDTFHLKSDIVETTISVAASFTMELQKTEALLDLIFLDNNQPKIITAGEGANAINEQLEALAVMQSYTRDFSLLADAAVRHSKLMTGCLCIFTNWQQEHIDFIQQLAALGTNFRCFVVSDLSLPKGPFTQLHPGQIQEDLLAL